MSYKSKLKGSKILVTGCCGTVGSNLIKKILNEIKKVKVIGIDNNESSLFFLNEKYKSNKNVNFVLCDIKNYNSVENTMTGVDVVFHCAAYKHVHLCEKNPDEAIATNIGGLQNLIDISKKKDVKTFVFTSSDKAVNPTNVMGSTKLMGERLISAAALTSLKTKFISTRFGNVLGSNGSVVEIFKKQLVNNDQLTITDFKMTRFVMTVDDAVDLVLKSSFLAVAGEVYVTKMPVIKIMDLAEAMIEIFHGKKSKTKIKEIGYKPGEKLYEELTTSEETRRAFEMKEYYCVIPAFTDKKMSSFKFYKKNRIKKSYSSFDTKTLSLNKIKMLIKSAKLM